MKIDLKKKIVECLRDDEQSRNSDIRLTQVVWWKFHRDKIKNIGGEMMIALKDLFKLPREDSIKRHRAIVQNIEKKYLPTSEEVRKKRRIAEEEWRKYVINSK